MMSLESKNCLAALSFFFGKKELLPCSMICRWKGKTLLLLNDLSLEREDVVDAVRYVLFSAKFDLTTLFKIGTPYNGINAFPLEFGLPILLLWIEDF